LDSEELFLLNVTCDVFHLAAATPLAWIGQEHLPTAVVALSVGNKISVELLLSPPPPPPPR
jgi:hypothetical protein